MSIAFVLHRSSVLFNDHGASEDEILVNDVVISASTTKDIANLSEPVVITFDMGEEVIREPQIPHWFPGGVIDVSSKHGFFFLFSPISFKLRSHFLFRSSETFVSIPYTWVQLANVGSKRSLI